MRSKAILVALLAFAFVAQATPISERQATLAARAWAVASKRFGTRLGSSVEQVRELALTNGASFFAVKMKGGGAVIVSGDSEDLPIVAMSSADISNPEVGSPLRTLLERDAIVRKNAVRSAAKTREAQRRWLRLVGAGEALDRAGAGEGRVPPSDVAPTDMRVPALVESEWGQDKRGENYYTPNHYVCGCVATAMAQVMRYHRFPVEAIDPFSATCYIDGVATLCEARGGVYDWDNMPLIPSTSMPDVKKEAIGHLTYDCGVAVGMDWGSSISSAFMSNVGPAMKLRFGYANAEVSTDTNISTDESLREKMIYASLDAGFPVQLGINRLAGNAGHAVVADGYGYIDDVSYVHLNMGWHGQGNVWYHLPDITYMSTSSGAMYEADIIVTCTYNVFPKQTGVVISGRTMADDGEVLAGAEVSVFRAGEAEPFTNLTSSAYGVYAVIVPAGDYTVSATAANGFSGETSISVADENTWGNDVVLRAPSVRVITSDGSSTNIWSTLDSALRNAALLEGATVEIFTNTVLKGNFSITNDCRIVAGPELVGPAPVERWDGAAITVDGATVVFADILFASASDTPVKAVNGGVAAFGGTTSVGETLSVWADAPGGFALAGVIDGGIQVYVEDAMTNGAVFGSALCDFATAQASAAKIINPENPDLGGEAFEDAETGDVLFRWAEVAVDPAAAVAAFRDAGGEWSYFRSFDAALGAGAVEVVLKKTSFMSAKFTPAQTVKISSENGAVLKVNEGAQFVAGSGVGITFSGIAVQGGKYLSDSLVVVNGGAVELQAGAAFERITVNNGSSIFGPFVVKSGKLTMLSGSAMIGCRALARIAGGGGGGVGGGVYVYSGAEFDMQGGTISGCYAAEKGGGVYADGNSSIRLSGDATISGNTAGETGADNDLSYAATSKPLVAGVMTGSVGVIGRTPLLNSDGAAFATGVSQAYLGASAGAFFSNAATDAGKVRTVFVDGNSLKWSVKDAPVGPFPVTPAYSVEGFITNAIARVIRASGTVDYWASVSDAFLSLDGDAVIEVLDDDSFSTNIRVSHAVVLRTAADSPNGAGYMAYLCRADNCGILVPYGASLVVENVEFSGIDYMSWGGGTTRFFDVDGGSLFLSNAIVSDVYGSADRVSAAIVVHGGGSVTLNGGTTISYCYNYFTDTDVNAGAAAGIVAEDEGTTVYLRDCFITDCYSRKTGGVFVGNKASIYISGNANVVDNSCDNDNSCGNMVVAAGGHLYLDGELTGFVGYAEGIGGNANVFGVVTSQLTPAVVASAANFVHDVTRARGSVNGTYLVWDLASRTPVAKPTPSATTVFSYDKTLHVVLADGEGYTVSDADGTYVRQYHAVARLDPGCVWNDGTSDAVVCDWTIEPAILAVVASSASKVEGENDPTFNYTVSGLVGDDNANNVISVSLVRDPGEDLGDYTIKLSKYELLDSNYSFDPTKSFTSGIFTIVADELLPPISDDAGLAEILAALEGSGVQDARVIAAVTSYYATDPDGARSAYNKFRSWAKENVGDAQAVCASENAWVSYEFGVTELFENTPTVTFTSIVIEDPSIAAMKVTLVVKDGGVEKDVDPESVAALFEMSTDLKNWTGDLTATANEDGSFTVKPNDSTLNRAVIRLRY